MHAAPWGTLRRIIDATFRIRILPGRYRASSWEAFL